MLLLFEYFLILCCLTRKLSLPLSILHLEGNWRASLKRQQGNIFFSIVNRLHLVFCFFFFYNDKLIKVSYITIKITRLKAPSHQELRRIPRNWSREGQVAKEVKNLWGSMRGSKKGTPWMRLGNVFLFTYLVRILRQASDKLIVNKDCIVSGCHKGVNFSVTKMPALNFKTRLANQ